MSTYIEFYLFAFESYLRNTAWIVHINDFSVLNLSVHDTIFASYSDAVSFFLLENTQIHENYLHEIKS